MHTQPGRPYPPGAAYDGTGVNFSLFSEVAKRVQLCLFDELGDEAQIDLLERTAFCWHGHLPDLSPGQRYGYRVHGPWNPEKGLRCRAAKLLLDPYAKAIKGDQLYQLVCEYFLLPNTSTTTPVSMHSNSSYE